MLLTSLDDLLEVPTPNLPFVIPTFNSKSYLEMMVKQLDGENIVIVDSCSTSESMREYLVELSKDHIVVLKPYNDGPHDYYDRPFFWRWLPEQFVVSDPDIGFNPLMPENYMEVIAELSEEQNSYKVGLALDIWNLPKENHLNVIGWGGLSIFNGELNHWQIKVETNVTTEPVYRAPTDSTFCYVNKKYHRGDAHDRSHGVRIAGNFTAQHYGWYKNPPMTVEEKELYYNTSKGSHSTTTGYVRQSNN